MQFTINVGKQLVWLEILYKGCHREVKGLGIFNLVKCLADIQMALWLKSSKDQKERNLKFPNQLNLNVFA